MNQRSTPQTVVLALNVIWASIAVSALLALVDKVTGHVTANHFMFNLMGYGLICIIPYKIGQRSNGWHYAFAILTVISVLMILGGVGGEITKLEVIGSILTIPMGIFALYKLFGQENWTRKTAPHEFFARRRPYSTIAKRPSARVPPILLASEAR